VFGAGGTAYHLILSRADQRRSPRFLYSEVVRVVACTGSEVLDDGDPIDTSDLVGKELVLGSAVPTVERDGWLIGARGFKENEGWTVWFAEDSLESTGLAEDWSKGDRWEGYRLPTALLPPGKTLLGRPRHRLGVGRRRCHARGISTP
jgi:hypothetical protein